MEDTPNNAQNAELLARMKKLEKENALLMKVADKTLLARHTPEEERGQTVLVSTYRKDLSDKPRLVTSWNLIRDEVIITKTGVEEDQIVEIILDDDNEIKNLETDLKRASKPEKIEEFQNKLVELKGMYHIQMSYKDFALRLIEKETVEVEGTQKSKDGTEKVMFNFQGKDRSLPIQFIN